MSTSDATAPDAAASPAESQRVGWLELFYDLVYVTLVAAVTHLLHGDPPVGRMLLVLGLLFVVWTVWFNEVQASNLARGLAPRHRGYVLASMAGVAVMAIGVPDLADGAFTTFALGYVLARLAMAPVWISQQHLTGFDATRAVLSGPLIALAAVLASAVGDARVFWAAFVVIELAMVGHRRRTTDEHEHEHGSVPHFDSGHLLERIGLFVMICFGEAVAQLVTALGPHRSPAHWTVGALGLLLVGLLFWCFYDVVLDRVEYAAEQAPDRLRELLGLSQLAIVAGILGVAAGLSGAIEHTGAHLTLGTLRLLAGGTTLAMLGLLGLSRDALHVLVTTSLAAGTAPSRPERRARTWWVLALAALNVAEVLAGPVVVLALGRVLPGWALVTVLLLGPAALLVTGSRPAPQPDDAPPASDLSPG